MKSNQLSALAQEVGEPVAWAARDWMRSITETELALIPNTGDNAGRRERCRALYPIALFARPQPAAAAAEVLAELVALEDMRVRLRDLHEMGHGTDYDNYHKRLPLAWEAARSVLAGSPAPEQGMVLVPREPTPEMIAAMEKQWSLGSAADMAKREYAAALSAAPTDTKENNDGR